ncbi:class I SAM-dependent DNA methyltransferase [Roseovarius pelagicus]|uniref:site-specific DNA-methyltransferase (adenine-specific) n=1 Tax=Roseovarius pelagicus TaxID=2980108 RepID=A0ABY6D7U4_9RHOB|nr:DNA methyltransferase [Roseovarius pelagicus]UXX82217.1 class I SAM-dependent DNA methyltransferase [Roseovarius pelagicus]
MQTISEFIERWSTSGGSERANYALFLTELTEVLGLEKPLPATDTGTNDHYRLERPVASANIGETTKKFIDFYRRGAFILETKQGSQAKVTDDNQLALPDVPKVKRVGHGVRGSRTWDKSMVKARGQADNYARGIAREDGWPPFIIVCDVGYVFEIYADFSGQGHGYTQYPDGNSFRIFLEDLEKPEVQELFRAIWNDPLSLDASKQSAKVTREIAHQLAQLGRSFEQQGHEPDKVAAFLMRCLFSMFAEDVDLIPRDSFTDLLREMSRDTDNAAAALESLWQTMNTGGFSPILKSKVLKFNGGLFSDAAALPLDTAQIAFLIGAANKDWKTVEPAIFGTLLERALDKRQRHKLGAHYTPRAYVERLVMPTVIEPLRHDWENVQTAAMTHMETGDRKSALAVVHAFHRTLCETRVLDPACGSGNFLYVALELMKRLEGEVTNLLEELGEEQTALGLASFTVDPHQFLGIELNPWAARVAELVLWIGYLQWHFRTYGKAAPAEPVLRDFHNIENRDAVLDHGETTPRMMDGLTVTRWDGITTKPHPVTGEEVPDDTARVQVMDYDKPRAAKWPEAEFIVGNPPFIGASRMRDALGDGYAEALWKAYPKMPKSADFVMFWWEKAALAARAWNPKTGKGARRFGFITTNSLRQTFNRKVLEPHLSDPKKPLSLIYAIPDHPWVDASMGAAVRIAMTVGRAGRAEGRLLTIAEERKGETEDEGRVVRFDEVQGRIFGNLRIGADVAGAKALKANKALAFMGMKLHGAGFILTPEEAENLISKRHHVNREVIRPYLNGRDLAQSSRGYFAIDLYPLCEQEARRKHPEILQHVADTVKPERDQNREPWRKEHWWWYGRTHEELRNASAGISSVIGTTRTAKHRLFSKLPADTIAESKIVVICIEQADYQAMLSSRFHLQWALAAGGMLGAGNDPTYNHTDCFNKFPFPDPTPAQTETLRALGEELDAHRKERQRAHPKLTLTQMYNVLEKRRAGDVIEGKDKQIYDDGLIGLLADIHDRIDAAVADAYGWPADLSDDDILHRLVALNHERAMEEARGHIRWLRPDYQNPDGKSADIRQQGEMEVGIIDKAAKPAWPKSPPEQVAAVRDALADMGAANPDQLARTFKRGRAASVLPLLESLTALGLATKTDAGVYRATR